MLFLTLCSILSDFRFLSLGNHLKPNFYSRISLIADEISSAKITKKKLQMILQIFLTVSGIVVIVDHLPRHLSSTKIASVTSEIPEWKPGFIVSSVLF